MRPAPLWRAAVPLALAILFAADPALARRASGGDVFARGLDLLDDWQLEDAKLIAEEVLADDPGNPEAVHLAGRVQHARGEHHSALSLLTAAREGGVREAEAVLPMAESSAAYAAHFETLESEHFRVRYLNKDEIVASYAVPVLEAAYRGIGAGLDFLAAERGEKIVVEIYPDARGLAGATGLTINEIETSGTIAVCKYHRLMITSPLATADGYEWADTIAHELAHLVISKKSRDSVPIWLHEGIAKYFESAWRGRAGDALASYSEKLLADAVRNKKLITYQQMHPSMAKLPSQEAAALAFAEVFTTIEYLVKGFGEGSVARVLSLAAEGLDIEQALKRVYGMGLSGIEASWRKYLLTRPFREYDGQKPRPIRLAQNPDDTRKEKPLEAIADRQLHDLARLGELLQLRGHTQAALVEYEKAYKKGGAAYSTLVYRLARAYVDSKRDAEALAVLDKALALQPLDADLHLLAGRSRLSRQDFAGAERHFEAVRLQNPFNPEIHKALRQLYEVKGDKEGAAREQRFYELAERPRPTRSYELPSKRAGSAKLNIVTRPFGAVSVDGERVAAPMWGYAVEPGEKRVVSAAGERKVSVAAGGEATVVLR